MHILSRMNLISSYTLSTDYNDLLEILDKRQYHSRRLCCTKPSLYIILPPLSSCANIYTHSFCILPCTTITHHDWIILYSNRFAVVSVCFFFFLLLLFNAGVVGMGVGKGVCICVGEDVFWIYLLLHEGKEEEEEDGRTK